MAVLPIIITIDLAQPHNLTDYEDDHDDVSILLVYMYILLMAGWVAGKKKWGQPVIETKAGTQGLVR